MHDEIASDASHAAPVQFAETVRKLIHAERTNANQEADETRQVRGIPFLVLLKTQKCWDNRHLKEVVFTELKAADNSPEQFEALLAPLLKADFDPASECAIRVLADARPERRAHALAAAIGLANYCAIHAWTYIWEKVSEDDEFGKDLFLRLAHSQPTFLR